MGGSPLLRCDFPGCLLVVPVAIAETDGGKPLTLRVSPMKGCDSTLRKGARPHAATLRAAAQRRCGNGAQTYEAWEVEKFVRRVERCLDVTGSRALIAPAMTLEEALPFTYPPLPN